MTRRKGTAEPTAHGPTRPRCGRPVKNRRCSRPAGEPVPERIAARLRIETAGRRGTTVTVVDGLLANAGVLEALVPDLEEACGAGGTAGGGRVEIQGDHRERLRSLLRARGWTVKG